MPYTLIGAHAGAKLSRKLLEVIKRSTKLIRYAKNKKFDLALTFNSASLVTAATFLRIRSMVFMDYEFQPLNHLTFRLCDKVVTPLCFPDRALIKFNALEKVIRYEGLKEEVYLADYTCCNNPLEQLNVNNEKVIVVVRPPATMALYHRFANDLFYETVQYILNNDNTEMIAFPRSEEQRKIFQSFGDSKLIIPPKAVDGRDILHHADLVLSAGGTMNREAGVLGVPAYTVFKGKIGAADKSLIAMGRIVPIRSRGDFDKISIQKAKQKISLANSNVRTTLINIILQE